MPTTPTSAAEENGEEAAAASRAAEPAAEASDTPPGALADLEPVAAELPPVEDLVKRLPAAVVTAMDELFRARWTGVRRLPETALTKDVSPRPSDPKADA